VESSFGDWQKAHRLAPNATREAAPLPLPSAQQLAGTSSFGMSGVNAHALFEAVSARPDGGSSSRQDHGAGLATLQRKRHWGLAPVYYLADRVLPAGGRQAGRCSSLVNLSKPELAYLWDHQVRPLPGAAVAGYQCCTGGAYSLSVRPSPP
jgi:hypothetical protein